MYKNIHAPKISIKLVLCQSLLMLFVACSGLETSTYSNIRKQNAVTESISRKSDDKVFTISQDPEQRVREPYSWEDNIVGSHSRISKNFFRCKGSPLNPIINKVHDSKEFERLYDCGGTSAHGLPLRGKQEFIYPILLDLLNYIQGQTHKQIIITCGHRCPQHNMYADSSSANQTSKHMIGAEVDFYVEGLEKQPEQVVQLIFKYYQEKYPEKKEYKIFQRYEKEDAHVSILPWYNKEIFIKLYQASEGRDFDNRHPYPYVCIQVRFDSSTQSKVIYNWKDAYKNYLKH